MRAIILLSLFFTGITVHAQDSLENKILVWTESTWQNGFGHRIYPHDPGNRTHLNIAARHNSSTWTDMLTLTSDGNVGIGDMNPLAKLSIGGDLVVKSSFSVLGTVVANSNYLTNSQIRIKGTSFKGSSAGLKLGDYSLPGSADLPDIEFTVSSFAGGFGTRLVPVDIQDGNGTTFLKFQSRSNSDVWSDVLALNNRTRTVSIANRLLVNNATDDGQTAMRVNGDIFTKRIKVTQTGWPDYVFEDNYKMPSLLELAAFIKEHKHLPEMPAAAEVAKDGLDLGEMNKKLLQKIEELTLYLLQQEKKMQGMQSEINELKNKFKQH